MADNVWTLKTNKFNSISAKKKTSKCKWTYSRSLIFLLWPSMRILRESSKGFVWPASLSFWCISFLSFFPSEISREYVTNSIRYGSYFLICAIAETITVSLDEWHYKKKKKFVPFQRRRGRTHARTRQTHTHTEGEKRKKQKNHTKEAMGTRWEAHGCARRSGDGYWRSPALVHQQQGSIGENGGGEKRERERTRGG